MRTPARALLAVLLLAALLPGTAGGHDVDELLWAHAPPDHWPTVFVATNVSYHYNPWLCDPHSRNQHNRAAHTPPGSNEGTGCRWPDSYIDKDYVPLWCGTSPLCPQRFHNWWRRNLPGRGNVDLLNQPWRFAEHDSENWPHHAVAVSWCYEYNDAFLRDCSHSPPPGSGFRFYSNHCIATVNYPQCDRPHRGLHDSRATADRQEIVEICIDDADLVAQHTDKTTGAVDQAALRAAWARTNNAGRMRHDEIIGWTGDALNAMSAHNGTPGFLWEWHPDMGLDVMHPANGHGTRRIPVTLTGDGKPFWSQGDQYTCHAHRDDLPIPRTPHGIADYGRRVCQAAADRNERYMRQHYGVVWEDDPTRYAEESARAYDSGRLPVPWGWTGGRQFRVAELADDSDGSDDWAMVPNDDGILVSTYVKQNSDFRLDADGQPIWVRNPEQPALPPGEPEWPWCVAPHGH